MGEWVGAGSCLFISGICTDRYVFMYGGWEHIGGLDAGFFLFGVG